MFSKIKSKEIFLIQIIFSFFVFLVPFMALADTPEAPGGAVDVQPAGGIVYVCTSGAPGDCRFEDLITAVKKVLNWGTIFALQFSVVVIAWAGFTYMTAGDSAGGRAKANKMLKFVVIGIIFIIAAWLIVTLILNALGVNNVVNLG